MCKPRWMDGGGWRRIRWRRPDYLRRQTVDDDNRRGGSGRIVMVVGDKQINRATMFLNDMDSISVVWLTSIECMQVMMIQFYNNNNS